MRAQICLCIVYTEYYHLEVLFLYLVYNVRLSCTLPGNHFYSREAQVWAEAPSVHRAYKRNATKRLKVQVS